MIIEIIAHAEYGKSKKRAGVAAEVHIFVDDEIIPRADITPARLKRAFNRWLDTGSAGKGFTVEVVEWTAGKRSSADYEEGTLNEGLRGALKKAPLDFGKSETDEEI